MWRLHCITALLLVAKYVAGYTIPLWLVFLPSYIYPSALFVVFVLAFLTGKIEFVKGESNDGK